MKQNPNNLIHKLPLKHKIVIAVSIPLVTSLIIAMFAIMGFKQIEARNNYILEKIAKTDKSEQHTELFEILEDLEKRIRFIQLQIIMITLISVIITLVLSFFMARIIQAQTDGLPGTSQE